MLWEATGQPLRKRLTWLDGLILTLSHPEALPWRVKSYSVRQSKLTKGTVLAGLGEKGLKSIWKKPLNVIMIPGDLQLCFILQGLVKKRWSGVPQMEKLEVRNVLSFYLMSNHQQLPAFVKNKLVKVLVDIGRQDWPHFYPDFFTNILEVCAEIII